MALLTFSRASLCPAAKYFGTSRSTPPDVWRGKQGGTEDRSRMGSEVRRFSIMRGARTLLECFYPFILSVPWRYYGSLSALCFANSLDTRGELSTL